MTALSAYEAGLAGRDCWMQVAGGAPRRLPVARWAGEPDEHDRAITTAVLDRAAAGTRVLDVGCGPGRLAAFLGAAGLRVRGIDISATAVELARSRGVDAVRADVFGPVPAIGPDPGWDRVLLADGNLGIGGDPVGLLRRLRGLLTGGGRVVADVRLGGGVVRAPAWIEAAGAGGVPIGGPVPWAWVGADAAARVGREAGLRLREVKAGSRRPVAVWELP